MISPAIADGIAENKEKMIDALYPIMGGMISKYVTQAIKEMMETINRKIEHGFSFERYKRKVKARLTGVSETELLLEESTDATIFAMFIIHKETGLLVSEAHLESNQIGDVHMVASMASAIKDFINDWISHRSEEKEEIQILSYGNATLYIESAGSVYVIAFLNSEPDYEQRTQINNFFASLVKGYSGFFQNFNGDDSAKEVSELSKKMTAYLMDHANEQEGKAPSAKKRNPAKLLFIVLGLALVVYAGYRVKELYDISRLQTRIASDTGEEVFIREEAGHYRLSGALDDPEHLSQIVKISRESPLGKDIETHLYLSLEGLEKVKQNVLKAVMAEQKESLQQQGMEFKNDLDRFKKEMTEKVSFLEKQQNVLKRSLEVYLQKKAYLHDLLRIRERIASDLKHALNGDPYYQEKEQSLNFAALHLFGAGEAVPFKEKMRELSASFVKYIAVLSKYKPYLRKIDICSFSDSKGDASSNMKLTVERAQNIRSSLLALPAVSQYGIEDILNAVGRGESEPVMIDGMEDYNASRRIMVRFVLDKDKIENEIEGLLDETAKGDR